MGYGSSALMPPKLYCSCRKKDEPYRRIVYRLLCGSGGTTEPDSFSDVAKGNVGAAMGHLGLCVEFIFREAAPVGSMH